VLAPQPLAPELPLPLPLPLQPLESTRAVEEWAGVALVAVEAEVVVEGDVVAEVEAEVEDVGRVGVAERGLVGIEAELELELEVAESIGAGAEVEVEAGSAEVGAAVDGRVEGVGATSTEVRAAREVAREFVEAQEG